MASSTRKWSDIFRTFFKNCKPNCLENYVFAYSCIVTVEWYFACQVKEIDVYYKKMKRHFRKIDFEDILTEFLKKIIYGCFTIVDGTMVVSITGESANILYILTWYLKLFVFRTFRPNFWSFFHNCIQKYWYYYFIIKNDLPIELGKGISL